MVLEYKQYLGKSYAGMFQTNYELFSINVMGMHGYGGQHVVIDFENQEFYC